MLSSTAGFGHTQTLRISTAVRCQVGMNGRQNGFSVLGSVLHTVRVRFPGLFPLGRPETRCCAFQLFSIGARRGTLAILGALALAIAPPLVESIVRIDGAKALPDSVFLAFVCAWLVSAVPGVIVGRRTLKAGGIDPDEAA